MPKISPETPTKKGVLKRERLTQSERKDISDAKMFEAAVDLIVERGAEQTTLKEVGEKSGYSRGLPVYRFGNKDGLFDFVLHRAGEQWLEELKTETAGKQGYDAIAASVDAHISHCENAPKQVEAFYRLWFESLSPNSSLKAAVLSIHERRRSDVKGWIDGGIIAGTLSTDLPSSKIANHFCTAVVGIVYQWLNAPEKIEELRALHLELKRTTEVMLGLGNAIDVNGR